jgi:hypothetical protein
MKETVVDTIQVLHDAYEQALEAIEKTLIAHVPGFRIDRETDALIQGNAFMDYFDKEEWLNALVSAYGYVRGMWESEHLHLEAVILWITDCLEEMNLERVADYVLMLLDFSDPFQGQSSYVH